MNTLQLGRRSVARCDVMIKTKHDGPARRITILTERQKRELSFSCSKKDSDESCRVSAAVGRKKRVPKVQYEYLCFGRNCL